MIRFPLAGETFMQAVVAGTLCRMAELGRNSGTGDVLKRPLISRTYRNGSSAFDLVSKQEVRDGTGMSLHGERVCRGQRIKGKVVSKSVVG